MTCPASLIQCSGMRCAAVGSIRDSARCTLMQPPHSSCRAVPFDCLPSCQTAMRGAPAAPLTVRAATNHQLHTPRRCCACPRMRWRAPAQRSCRLRRGRHPTWGPPPPAPGPRRSRTWTGRWRTTAWWRPRRTAASACGSWPAGSWCAPATCALGYLCRMHARASKPQTSTGLQKACT